MKMHTRKKGLEKDGLNTEMIIVPFKYSSSFLIYLNRKIKVQRTFNRYFLLFLEVFFTLTAHEMYLFLKYDCYGKIDPETYSPTTENKQKGENRTNC